MPHLQLQRKTKVSAFRKIALGTWRVPGDPSVYGSMAVRMEESLRYLDAFREATGKRLTLSHMMAKAAAAVLKGMPDANAILRWHRIYLRQDISVFFQVVMEDPRTGEIDLSGTVVHNADRKTLEEIVDEFSSKVESVRAGKDRSLERSRGAFRRVPGFMMGALMRLTSFLSYTLNLDLRWAGIPRDPFGSLMITNIGTLGLEVGYVPLVPYSRVPLLVAMGKVTDEPVVEDGAVVVGKVMRLSVTFDHRILDGAHAAAMAKTVRAWMEHPFDHFDRLDPARARPSAAAPR